VIFSYPLRKYQGNDGVASNITINSSAKCKRRPVHAIGHDTSVSLPTIVGTCTYTWLDCLLTIYIVNATYPQLEEESLAFLYSAFQSSEVLLKHHIAGSVRTASDRVLGNKCSSTCVYIHLLHIMGPLLTRYLDMYLEDANGFREQWNRAGTILTCDVCIAIDYPSQKYDQELNPIYDFNSKLLLWLPTFGKIAGWGSKYNITVRDYFDEGRRSFCSGLGTVFGNAQSPLKPQESELYAATLLARIPVLAIARADKGLPQKSLDGHALENYVISRLEVKWARVGWIAAALMSGQFLVIAFVLWYCCYMKIPEDSPVPTAEILKEVTSGMTEVHGGLFRYDGRNIVRTCANKEV